MRDLLISDGDPAGLFQMGVLGRAEGVIGDLGDSLVLQHELADIRHGEPQPLSSNRNHFNNQTPTTVAQRFTNRAELRFGGIECGKQAMGEAAGTAGGLRPGVVDARGGDWDGGGVRGLISESPQAHDAKGCPHFFAGVNWMMKRAGASLHDKRQHLIALLATVAGWLYEGRHTNVHCIPLLFPPRRFWGESKRPVAAA